MSCCFFLNTQYKRTNRWNKSDKLLALWCSAAAMMPFLTVWEFLRTMCAWTTSSMCEVISFISSMGLTLNATTDLWFWDRKNTPKTHRRHIKTPTNTKVYDKYNANNMILRASSCRDLTHFLMHQLAVEECRMCLSGHSTEHYKTINSPGRSEGCRRLWRRCLEAGRCCPHRGPNRKQTKIRTRMFQLCLLESKIAEALNMR